MAPRTCPQTSSQSNPARTHAASPNMRRAAVLALMLILLLAIAAFGGCAKTIDDSGDPGIIGTISSIDIPENGGDTLAVILVEGTQEENAGLISDKASVAITKDTVLSGSNVVKYFEKGDLVLLEVGARVEVVFTGPVAESYPVQGGAKVLRLL